MTTKRAIYGINEVKFSEPSAEDMEWERQEREQERDELRKEAADRDWEEMMFEKRRRKDEIEQHPRWTDGGTGWIGPQPDEE